MSRHGIDDDGDLTGQHGRDPQHGGRAQAPVGHVRSAEALQRERGDDAGQQPSDVPADRDARHEEREGQVEEQQRHDRADQHHAAPFQHEQRAHEREDRARCSDGRGARVRREQRAGAAAQGAEEVDDPEAQRADVALEPRAEDVERIHVEGDVQQVGVQEGGADDAPPVAGCHRLAGQRAVLEDPARAHAAALGHERRDVDADQRVGHGRLPGGQRARAQSARAPRALRAAHADRRGLHALRADGAIAARAAHARRLVRVPVAGRLDGVVDAHRRDGSRGCAHGVPRDGRVHLHVPSWIQPQSPATPMRIVRDAVRHRARRPAGRARRARPPRAAGRARRGRLSRRGALRGRDHGRSAQKRVRALLRRPGTLPSCRAGTTSACATSSRRRRGRDRHGAQEPGLLADVPASARHASERARCRATCATCAPLDTRRGALLRGRLADARLGALGVPGCGLRRRGRRPRSFADLLYVARLGPGDPADGWQRHVAALDATRRARRRARPAPPAPARARHRSADRDPGGRALDRGPAGRATRAASRPTCRPRRSSRARRRRARPAPSAARSRSSSRDAGSTGSRASSSAGGWCGSSADREADRDYLAAYFDRDEGAGRLGEVALVPPTGASARPGAPTRTRCSTRTPPATSRFGQGLGFTRRPGAQGVNRSVIHTDVMIGPRTWRSGARMPARRRVCPCSSTGRLCDGGSRRRRRARLRRHRSPPQVPAGFHATVYASGLRAPTALVARPNRPHLRDRAGGPGRVVRARRPPAPGVRVGVRRFDPRPDLA